MANEKDLMDDEFEDDGTIVVTFEGPNGEELYYAQEMLIETATGNFATMIGINVESGEEDEDDVIICKIIKDEDGEDLYIDPTEEEFELAKAKYEEICDEEGIQ